MAIGLYKTWQAVPRLYTKIFIINVDEEPPISSMPYYFVRYVVSTVLSPEKKVKKIHCIVYIELRGVKLVTYSLKYDNSDSLSITDLYCV